MPPLAPAPHHLHAGDLTPLAGLVRRRSQTTSQLVARLSGVDGFLLQPVDAISGTRVRINDRWVLNFTSSNYLGFTSDPGNRAQIAEHSRRWGASLSTPRLLATDALTRQLETELAALVKREAALLFPSTLHAAIDVLTLLAGTDGRILIDEHAYPISMTAARLATGPTRQPIRFRHDDPGTVGRLLSSFPPGRDTVVVVDGVYSERGVPATLRQIGEQALAAGASVYVDDAHGFGLLGVNPSRDQPYGTGGGGTVLHTGALPDNIAYVSSLSKALGVPLAFVAGPAAFIDHLRSTSASVVHSSPPALPVVAAALATLRVHAECGDDLRRRLLANVRHFQHGAASLGLPIGTTTAFPIQSIAFPTQSSAIATGKALRQRGIWPVLSLGGDYPNSYPSLRFVMTTAHSAGDIDALLFVLREITTETSQFVEDR